MVSVYGITACFTAIYLRLETCRSGDRLWELAMVTIYGMGFSHGPPNSSLFYSGGDAW